MRQRGFVALWSVGSIRWYGEGAGGGNSTLTLVPCVIRARVYVRASVRVCVCAGSECAPGRVRACECAQRARRVSPRGVRHARALTRACGTCMRMYVRAHMHRMQVPQV